MQKTEAQELVSRFAYSYRDTLEVPYVPVWGRDVKIINDLLLYVDKDTLEQLIKLYFKSQESEYCIPYFKVKINRLLLEHKESLKRAKKMSNPYAERFL